MSGAALQPLLRCADQARAAPPGLSSTVPRSWQALEEGLTCAQICDKYHAVHKGVYEWFGISFGEQAHMQAGQRCRGDWGWLPTTLASWGCGRRLLLPRNTHSNNSWVFPGADKFGRTPTRAQTQICQSIFKDLWQRGACVEQTMEQVG
jgi:methionyl-tRNA synthetase